MSPIEVNWDGDENHRDCGEFPLPVPVATDEPHWLEVVAGLTGVAVSLWLLYGCAWRLLLAFDRLIGY
jgi:hypothetical protein